MCVCVCDDVQMVCWLFIPDSCKHSFTWISTVLYTLTYTFCICVQNVSVWPYYYAQCLTGHFTIVHRIWLQSTCVATSMFHPSHLHFLSLTFHILCVHVGEKCIWNQNTVSDYSRDLVATRCTTYIYILYTHVHRQHAQVYSYTCVCMYLCTGSRFAVHLCSPAFRLCTVVYTVKRYSLQG